jgi:hypothetical protein
LHPEALSAVRAFLRIDAVNTGPFNDGFFGANPVPDAGETLNAFFTNGVFHDRFRRAEWDLSPRGAAAFVGKNAAR